jgi:hypothetical protein
MVGTAAAPGTVAAAGTTVGTAAAAGTAVGTLAGTATAGTPCMDRPVAPACAASSAAAAAGPAVLRPASEVVLMLLGLRDSIGLANGLPEAAAVAWDMLARLLAFCWA